MSKYSLPLRIRNEPASTPYHSTRLVFLSAAVLSAVLLVGSVAPAQAIPFTTFALAVAAILDTSDPNQTTVVASLRDQAPPDQALIDISAPLSLPVEGATLSALATFRAVVTPTSSGGIVSFGTAEATTTIDPLLATPVVFPVAHAEFVLRFDSGNAPMAVAFSGAIHVSGAELTFIPVGLDALKVRSGGVLFFPVESADFGRFEREYFLPKPADIPFALSTVVRPNSTLNFSVFAEVIFEDPANLSTNFRDSRLDFTFTATPVAGPSPLLLLVGGFAAIGLIFGRRFTAKRQA